ncbi:hypothetical protein IT072_16940 [Leifsonia sp. ZF2019]|uniref:hypothetical protein n=1 Tax=Leifsonia sp. ZF2019 TaxID=2781978 RepID=UPI001CC144B1|nr:hypothetical protein [Leifsonia sp. ZF2019]UAJ78889.1 hypothetical protein IT072_16940 [Leifsonia sp. ZF2019]
MNSLPDDVHGADDETVVSPDGYVYRFPASVPEHDRQVGLGRPDFRVGYIDVAHGCWQATTIDGVILTGDGCSDDAVRALLDLSIGGSADE